MSNLSTLTDPAAIRVATSLSETAGISLPQIMVDEKLTLFHAWCICLSKSKSEIYLPALLLKMKDNLLQIVLAHEIGHIAGMHPVKKGLIRLAAILAVALVAVLSWQLAVSLAIVLYVWIWPNLSMQYEYDADRRAAEYIDDAEAVKQWLVRCNQKKRLAHLEKIV